MNLIKNLIKRMLTPAIFIVLFALAFILEDIQTIFSGYIKILTHPSVLISDYLEIGGIGATLFNVASILLINILILVKLKVKISGPVFAGLFTIAGFSFFGKNLINTIPIYLGIYLFSRVQKLDYKSFIIVVLFSTGISPIVSFIFFGTGWPLFISIPAGILIGLITGFVLPALSAHTIRFHKGYNLYNIGFAMGILSMLYGVILRAFGVELKLLNLVNNDYHLELLIITLVISIVFIISAFLINPKVCQKYPELIKRSGRSVSDFIRDHGQDTSMLNVGIMGLISIGFLSILGLTINGPVMGGILTVMGFGAFGKHPRNSLPVMIGALIGVTVTNYSLESTGMVIALLFVTAVAPIAGRYGIIIGIIAGFVHILITPIAYSFQGGFDLYNNGFAAGFVAALFIPFLEATFKKNVEEVQT